MRITMLEHIDKSKSKLLTFRSELNISQGYLGAKPRFNNEHLRKNKTTHQNSKN